MGLTLAAIRRPVWVWMLMIFAIVMGYIGCKRMPVEQNPEIEFPVISISTSYFGANPTEIETLISRPIEDSVSGLSGLKSVQSQSLEGLSVVTVEFELGTNLDTALSDVNSAVSAITGQLPRDAERPVVQKVNIAGEPILYLAAESSTLTPLQLRDIIDDRVVDRLSRIPGVADVAVSGGEEREIRIAVDRQRLLSYGLGVSDVLNAMQNATQNVPGGRITDGNRESAVRVKGEFESVDEIRRLVIPVSDRQDPNAGPAIVRVGDIATISDQAAERTSFARINGRDAAIITVQKSRDGNTVNITDQAKAALAELSKTYPIQFTITRESAKQVNESLEDLEMALIIGIILVIGIIYMFLHNFRGTLIVALAIPTCIMAAFAAIYAFGYTLNTMTMLGLSLAIGILVDDAIVVLENTYRHLYMGEEPETAALNGRLEIGLAAVSITLIDVAVFLPIAFMGGIVGQFMRPFAVTVAAATLFSLFVSFTLTPMLASRWYRRGENLEDKHGFAKKFDNWLHAFANAYKRRLDWALNHRWTVIAVGFGLLLGVFMMIGGGFAPNLQAAIKQGTGMLLPCIVVGAVLVLINLLNRRRNLRPLVGGALFGAAMLGFTVLGYLLSANKGGPIFDIKFFPEQETGQIAVNITMPPSASLERTLQVVERIEGIAKRLPDMSYITSNIGFQTGSNFGQIRGSQYGQVLVTLREKKALLDAIQFWKKKEGLRTRSQESIASDLREMIGKVPDANIVVSSGGGFGIGAPVQVNIRSIRPEQVLPAALKAKETLAKIPGIINLDLSSKPGKPEYLVRPDRVRLADNDISVGQLGAVMRVAYEGNVDAKYREGGREYDIRVNMTDAVRNDPNALAAIPVTFRQGNPVFVGNVAKIEGGVGPDKVDRQDRQRRVTVTGHLLPGYVIGTVGRVIDSELAKADLGKDVVFKQGGENEIQGNEMPYMAFAFGLALILVYFVLASLFDNIVYPLIIQLAQPQALVGALLFLMMTNTPFGIVGFIGFIMLIGLVGKNAILLVDFANTLRGRGIDRHNALLESGVTRMRPILMTTIALVLAMIPVALALGRGSEFRAPLGITIIGGMTLSTLLTLFVIPCTYTVFDDFSSWIRGILGKVTGRVGRPESTESLPQPADQEVKEPAADR
ncbi:MAG: efflux RND transporter permease subunit [Armatimonadetes bacterium]|nr:efflux RND transporter permease subunit [Armatimonadota bacterium]NOG94038.1 efflux RND transporter permease subunit [Armatimonadota bacterium]